MTNVRSSVTEHPNGSLTYTLRCSCVTVRDLAAGWEGPGDVWARLAAEHRRRAPLCQHRLTVEVTA